MATNRVYRGGLLYLSCRCFGMRTGLGILVEATIIVLVGCFLWFSVVVVKSAYADPTPVPLFKRDGMIYFQYQGEVWACVRTGETSVGCVDPNNLEYACRYLDETAGFFDNCVKAMSIRYNGKTFPKGSTA